MKPVHAYFLMATFTDQMIKSLLTATLLSNSQNNQTKTRAIVLAMILEEVGINFSTILLQISAVLNIGLFNTKVKLLRIISVKQYKKSWIL